MSEKIKRLFILYILAAVVLLAVNCSSGEETTGTGNGETTTDITITTTEPTADQLPAPGRIAPDFSLVGLDGKMISLKDYQGSPVLLNFWATWCGPCRFEMHFIQEIYRDPEWQAAGLEIIAVNIGESGPNVEEFLSDNGLTFPVVLDLSTEVAKRYNIRAIPTTFFIDKDGIIERIDVGAFVSKQEIDERLLELISGDG
jgi:peroxiredoxin